MDSFADRYRKFERYYVGILVVLALTVLSVQITAPFIDYDEATYAKVVVDTIRSGDISTFTLFGQPWFEKPPLYLWSVIASVKIFGIHEWAFRLPSVLASLSCLLLVYLITRKLTASPITAAASFLLLLSTLDFYHLGNQVRLDAAVLMAMLSTLYFFIRGWKEEKYLLGILPTLAVGFLFKSFIVVLIVPILLIYSYFYSEWKWVKSRYLWTGLPVALVIWTPWHLLETMRFGSAFWNQYFVQQVFQRSVSTITGQGNYYDYVFWLYTFGQFWFVIVVSILAVFLMLPLSQRFRSSQKWKYVAAPVFSVLFLLVFFTFLRTHLSPYILPIFPFIAMFIAILCFYAFPTIKQLALVPVVLLIFVGACYSLTPANVKVMQSEYEEANIGLLYKEHNIYKPAPLYVVDWPALETLNYYADTRVTNLSSGEGSGKILKGPMYVVAPLADNWPLFFDEITGKPMGGPLSPNEVYVGKVLVLLYSENNIRTAH